MNVSQSYVLLDGPPLGVLFDNSNTSTVVPSTSRAPDKACDAIVHPPLNTRSFRANHIADLLGGLPPARHGLGRDYLETDPDNPIPWAVTDATYKRVAGDDKPIKQERERFMDKHRTILTPQTPLYNEFPGPRPEGDPQPTTSRHPPVDGPRWTKKEQREFLNEAMKIEFPPHVEGVVETRNCSAAKPETVQGLEPELDAMMAAHALKTRRYEEFHVEWRGLQIQLTKKAEVLRAEYVRLVEAVERLHHLFIRNRITKDEYKPARRVLVQQMDAIFATLGKVVHTLGAMYAEARAVAQAISPPGGFNYGKLDVVRVIGGTIDAEYMTHCPYPPLPFLPSQSNTVRHGPFHSP